MSKVGDTSRWTTRAFSRSVRCADLTIWTPNTGKISVAKEPRRTVAGHVNNRCSCVLTGSNSRGALFRREQSSTGCPIVVGYFASWTRRALLLIRCSGHRVTYTRLAKSSAGPKGTSLTRTRRVLGHNLDAHVAIR